MSEAVASWVNSAGIGIMFGLVAMAYVFYYEYRYGAGFSIEFKDWDEIKPW
jgi:hypothetical protein